MAYLYFLGKGSAFHTKLGNNSAAIVYGDKDDRIIFIDCGSNTFERIMDSRALSGMKQASVVLTHLHPDHVGSLGDLIFYSYYVLKQKLVVFFPRALELEELLKAQGVEPDLYESLGDEGLRYEFGNEQGETEITFEPVLVNHVPELYCYGYYIGIEGQQLYYSGDTNQVNPDMVRKLHAGELHSVYHDTCLAEYEGNVHTSLTELKKAIPEQLREHVYVMHIDNDALPQAAKAAGFQVVDTIFEGGGVDDPTS